MPKPEARPEPSIATISLPSGEWNELLRQSTWEVQSRHDGAPATIELTLRRGERDATLWVLFGGATISVQLDATALRRLGGAAIATANFIEYQLNWESQQEAYRATLVRLIAEADSAPEHPTTTTQGDHP